MYVLSGDDNNTGGSFDGGYQLLNPSGCFPGYLSSSNGVYKSVNGGMTWVKLAKVEGNLSAR
jgi:hypothetical protein